MRLPDRLLEHRVTLRPILPVGSSGRPRYAGDIRNVHALVVEKAEDVTDQRPTSESNGGTITATGHIVMQIESWVPPESLVIVWEGTPQERTATVVATLNMPSKRAPASAQLWFI